MTVVQLNRYTGPSFASEAKNTSLDAKIGCVDPKSNDAKSFGGVSVRFPFRPVKSHPTGPGLCQPDVSGHERGGATTSAI